MQRLVLVIAFVCALAVPARAGFDEGVAAYDRGDYATAFREWRPLAEQGDAAAQNNLGLMYDNGQGVPQDYAEAARWYRLAAEQGNASAMNNLGVMYEHGRGVPPDLVQAYAWYNLAAARVTEPPDREKAVRNRDDVAERLSPQKLTRAQALARQMDSDLASGRDPADTGTSARLVPSPDRRVVEVQQSLASLGYDPGPADGRLGPRTRAAIRAFEADNGLPVTGSVSDGLRGALAAALILEDILRGRPEEGRERKLELASTGTGFVVSAEGHVLTNHHVVEGCKEVRGRDPPHLAQSAAIVVLNPKDDLALLQTSRWSLTDLIIGERAVAIFRDGRGVRPGDGVVAVGFPLHGLLASGVNVTTGTVSALAGIRDDIRYLQITAPVQPGNSGGPLLDMSGNVVGVVVGKLDALAVAELTGDIPQNVNFAIKDSVARAFLDANRIDYETAASKGGIDALDAADVGERASRFTVLLECWK